MEKYLTVPKIISESILLLQNDARSKNNNLGLTFSSKKSVIVNNGIYQCHKGYTNGAIVNIGEFPTNSTQNSFRVHMGPVVPTVQIVTIGKEVVVPLEIL